MCRIQHVTAALVALAWLATAAAGGGYSSEFRAGAALAVWAAVIVGLGLGFWPRARVPRAALVAGGGLLAFTLLTALSMAWAADQGQAFSEAVRAAAYLGLFVLVVLASPAGGGRGWLAGLALGLLAVSVLALGSRVEPSLFPEQQLAEFLPGLTRLSYPLNYWNALGACMALALVLLAWFGGHGESRAGRALAVAATPFPALVLYLTSSRGAVVALAVGLAALLALGPGRARMLAGALLAGAGGALLIVLAESRQAFVDGRVEAAGAAAEGREMLLAVVLVGAVLAAVRLALDRPLDGMVVPRAIALAGAGAVAVALVLGIVAADPAERLDRFNDPPETEVTTRGFVADHLTSSAGAGRYQFWGSALDAFESEPVRGIGAGGYEAWWARHGSLRYFIRDAHSLFAETLAELGLLGLVALLVFLGGSVAAGLAARRAPPLAAPAGAALAVLACATASAAVDWTWEVPAAFGPLVVAAALLAGPATAAGEHDRESRFGLGVATLGLAWVAAIAATVALATEAKLDDSREAVRSGELDQAASDAAAARALSPWSGVPSLQLALVRERRGDLDGARRAAGEAADRDEEDWRVWLVVARLALRDGDVPEARRALRRARTLNPRSPIFRGPGP